VSELFASRVRRFVVMKGVVFNLLEAFIIEGWGEDTLDDIMEVCPLHTTEPFVGPKTYPDADLFAIVGAACAKLGVSTDVAVRAFGKFSFPHLAGRFPVFLEGHDSARSFLLSVHDVIHVEVNKLMEGSVLPDFVYREGPNGTLIIDYYSRRKLCFFMEGLIDGVAEHFGERIEQTQTRCVHRGDPHCTFELEFVAKAVAA